MAQRRRGPVGRLGQRRQAGPPSRGAQPVRALLPKGGRALGDPRAAGKAAAAHGVPSAREGPSTPTGAGGHPPSPGWRPRVPATTFPVGRGPASPLPSRFFGAGAGGSGRPAPRLLDALCPGCPGPETTHHGGVSVHQHGEDSVGREAWRRHSPRPTARREFEPRAPAARGDRRLAAGVSQPGARRVWDPQRWAPADGSMEVGRPGADGPWKKSVDGCPAPALLPLSSACSMHSSYSGGAAPGLWGRALKRQAMAYLILLPGGCRRGGVALVGTGGVRSE